jgi:chromosome segregation ATPase
MSDPLLLNCDAVLGPFRQWQAEQEPIDAQLSESLSALAAYQSHLDEWQQQLACERDELRLSRELWECERGDAEQSKIQITELAAELSAARDEISTLTKRLDSSHEELRAERERLQQAICEAAERADSETSSNAGVELAQARVEIENLTSALSARADELRAVREQLDLDCSAADSMQARLNEVTVELSAAREEIAGLTKCLSASEEELRAERQKIEYNESSADQHQAQLAELTTELNAARDKVAALTAMLLSRTEELRTLDISRAENSAELELVRVRERELAAALEELRQTREREHEQWADESRHMREMVEQRRENVEQEQTVERELSTPPVERSEAKAADRTVENPVFASVKEQFGKLRQQRAMAGGASKKAR